MKANEKKNPEEPRTKANEKKNPEEPWMKANGKKNRIPAGSRQHRFFFLKNMLKNGTGCKKLCVLRGNRREKSAIFMCKLARM